MSDRVKNISKISMQASKTTVSTFMTSTAILKNLTPSNRWCDCCDISNVEDVRHLVLYCSSTQPMRDRMFIEVDRLVDGRGKYSHLSINGKLDVLLGSLIRGLDPPSMIDIWLTGASFIGMMYNHRVRSRKGIG